MSALMAAELVGGFLDALGDRADEYAAASLQSLLAGDPTPEEFGEKMSEAVEAEAANFPEHGSRAGRLTHA